MFWNLFKKKPAPKPEPEKKTPPVPIGDVCINYPQAKYP